MEYMGGFQNGNIVCDAYRPTKGDKPEFVLKFYKAAEYKAGEDNKPFREEPVPFVQSSDPLHPRLQDRKNLEAIAQRLAAELAQN